jgi:hypothetical protein
MNARAAVGSGAVIVSKADEARAVEEYVVSFPSDKIVFPDISSGRSERPFLLERPMTIIAAMDCEEYVLLASDSEVTEAGGIKVSKEKIYFLSDRPIAWGTAGDEGIGLRFNEWIQTYRWTASTTWAEFVDGGAAELSRLNGRKRELAELARVKIEDNDLATALIAGCIGGSLDVWELTDRGGASSVKHNVFSAIGSGQPHALVVFFTLRNAFKAKFQPNAMMMGFILELVSHLAPMCGLPVKLLRVSKEKVESARAPGEPPADDK